MNRGDAINRALKHASGRGFLTIHDISVLAPSGTRRKPSATAMDWCRRGWIRRVARQKYELTSVAYRRLDEVERCAAASVSLTSFSLVRVREHVARHGAITSAETADLLSIDRRSAYQMLYRWTKRGLLRRTHVNTYRLPKEASHAA